MPCFLRLPRGTKLKQILSPSQRVIYNKLRTNFHNDVVYLGLSKQLSDASIFAYIKRISLILTPVFGGWQLKDCDEYSARSLLEMNIILLKSTHNTLVFAKQNHVIKLVFAPPRQRERELYYSHLFYPGKVYTVSSEEASLLVFPRYGHNLDSYYNYIPPIPTVNISQFEVNQLQRDLIHQISTFHESKIVHHDVKPSNIVKSSGFKYNWTIIDFGVTCTHPPLSPGELLFQLGTVRYNVPKYACLNNCSLNDKVFWLFMKDWFGFGKIMSGCGVILGNELVYRIESMHRNHVINILKDLIKDEFPLNDLFYLNSK